jgi:localization factor PodJL
MSGGAQPWSVKGIDPKAREAAREAARRQGMTLGEWLNQAIMTQGLTGPGDGGHEAPPVDEDWSVGHDKNGTGSREADMVANLAKRFEASDRRNQLAVAGLDRAMTTLDRSLLGLSARIDEAEATSAQSQQKLDAAAAATAAARTELAARVAAAEHAANSAAGDVKTLQQQVHERIQQAAVRAHEQALRATLPVLNDLKAQQDRLAARIQSAEEDGRALSQEAQTEIRALKDTLNDRVGALSRTMQEQLAAPLSEMRSAHASLSARIASAEAGSRDAANTAVAEMRAMQQALAARIERTEQAASAQIHAAVSDMQSRQQSLVARLEAAETAAKDQATTLRQAAGAAIADLRNAQIGLQSRIKAVEETDRGGGEHVRKALDEVKAEQQALAARVDSSVQEARTEAASAFQTLDDSLKRMAERIAAAETNANSAIRSLEDTIAALSERAAGAETAQADAAALRDMVETRLDGMARQVATMVEEAQATLSQQVESAVSGVNVTALEGAIADVNRRLAGAERRQAQTIEAISAEIARMSETVERRLRAVEERNDVAAAAAVRESFERLNTEIEQRFGAFEDRLAASDTREAAGMERMGEEIGRLSERLEDRFARAENRSAQAIEQVGEQVARMAERFNARQEELARDVAQTIVDSEERGAQRLNDALSGLAQRLAEIDGRAAEAVTPLQKAMTSVAARLQALENTTPTSTYETTGLLTPAGFVTPSDAAARTPEEPEAVADVVRAPAPPAVDEPLGRATDFDASDFDEPSQMDAPPPPAEDTPGRSQAAPPAPSDPFREALSDLDSKETPLDDDIWADPVDPREPLVMGGLEGDPEPSSKLGENYLAAARRAAMAQAANGKGRKKRDAAPTDAKRPKAVAGLRGTSRVVLWGAGGVVALVALGATYLARPGGAPAPAENEPPPPPGPSPAAASVPEVDAAAGLEVTPDVIDPAAAGDSLDTPLGVAAEPGPSGDPSVPLSGAQPLAGRPDAAAAVAGAARLQPTSASASEPRRAGPAPTRPQSLEQAASRGDAVAQYELALVQFESGSRAQGLENLRRAAGQGLAMAQYRLAKLYERGEGVPADLAQARQWTERAAANGNRRAMHDLGVYFARGEGAPFDEAAAFRWFRQAAELGVADSQFNLGVMYEQGRGVDGNPTEALFWFLVAAGAGDADARNRAETLQAQLTPSQVERATARAAAFRPRTPNPAANGDFPARSWATPS